MTNAFNPIPALAKELNLNPKAITATLALFGDGATVPFIARYRKEATDGLDEVQIRAIEERHAYLKELHERRVTVLKSIAEQGKLDDALTKKLTRVPVKLSLKTCICLSNPSAAPALPLLKKKD